MEHLETDPPRNSLCTLLRLVRLEKRFNNELYRTRNVDVSRQLLADFLPPHGGQSYTHQSCAKVLGLTWGAAVSFPGDRSSPAHPAEMYKQAGAWVCAQVPWAPRAPWLLERVSSSCLYVRPLKVFMQV